MATKAKSSVKTKLAKAIKTVAAKVAKCQALIVGHRSCPCNECKASTGRLSRS